MSRLYDVEVHVHCPDLSVQLEVPIADEWGMHIETNTESQEENRDVCFIGTIVLCGGNDEHDAHEHLKDLLPKGFKVTTKWLCQEYREWDEVIEDED